METSTDRPRSRRSNINLQHLSLAPLTTRTMDEDDGHQIASPTSSPYRRTSYLEGRSAPATPGVLSRAPSTARLHGQHAHHRQHYHHDQRYLDQGIPKSKSSSHLLPTHPRRTNRGWKPLRRQQNPTVATSTDWLLRAGAVLSSEARESKGQSWLASRTSSTSLVGYGDDAIRHPDDVAFADDEYSPLSTRPSRVESFSSRKNSRRGSRVRSKAELRTPLGARTPSRLVEGEENVFDDEFAMGPQFVDPDDEQEQAIDDAELEEEAQNQLKEDAEMDRLTREKGQLGFGLSFGNWIDHLVDWSLFSGADDEDAESGGEDDDPNVVEQGGASSGLQGASNPAAETPTTNKKEAREEQQGNDPALDDAKKRKGSGNLRREKDDDDDTKNEDDHNKNPEGRDTDDLDMAWLMSVATKVFF